MATVPHLEFERDIVEVELMINAFQTVKQWSAHECDMTPVGLHLCMGMDAAHRHRKIDSDAVAGVPCTADHAVTVVS